MTTAPKDTAFIYIIKAPEPGMYTVRSMGGDGNSTALLDSPVPMKEAVSAAVDAAGSTLPLYVDGRKYMEVKP